MKQDALNPEPPPAGRAAKPESQSPARIAVVIASKGRPLEMSYVLQALATQTQPPSAIILSVVCPEDLPPHEGIAIPLLGPAGLTRQRNLGMEHALALADIIVFFDDDFIPAKTALAGIAQIFDQNPGIAGASGLVLRDGVTSGGLTWQSAAATLQQFEAAPPPLLQIRNIGWAYGCNMAFRASAIGGIRFDENLPLYGWQEDVDFSMRVGKSGRIVRTNAFAGVHLGVAKSRTPGFALGYSQIINPVYLVRKGSMPPAKAAWLMARNLAANHVMSLSPEAWIDRRGRALGNWRGIAALLRGQIDPTAILKF